MVIWYLLCSLILHWWNSSAEDEWRELHFLNSLLITYHFPCEPSCQENMHFLFTRCKKRERWDAPFEPPSHFPAWSWPMSALLHPWHQRDCLRLQVQITHQRLHAEHPSFPRTGSARDNVGRKMSEVSDQLRINQCRIPRRSFLHNRSALEEQVEEQESSSWNWSHPITY